MSPCNQSNESANVAALRYHLTAKGKACVDYVETDAQTETVGSLSHYLHDVLLMCGTVIWFQELRQFMPLRSLEESLQTLQSLGLIECQELSDGTRHMAPSFSRVRPVSAFGHLART